MLKALRLKNVGPAPEMAMEFGERLNLITGDNGLGKSFLLDVAWWVLTRRWPREVNSKLTSGYPARPTNPRKPATIEFRLKSKTKAAVSYSSRYDKMEESWVGKAGRPWNPGLVIYASADGGFSVWDPARNYWKTRGNTDIQERLPGYVFSPSEVWDGLRAQVDGREVVVCNGLIHDWAGWIRENGELALLMSSFVQLLSPSLTPRDHLRPGPLVRIGTNDVRDIPSLKTPYAPAVPILFASAGVRRVVALAYMLLWSYTEHFNAAELRGDRVDKTRQVILLVDELESHLHPRWQRSILRSLLTLTKLTHLEASIQLIAVTHSPLVLASAEPTFDPKTDAWFDLDLTPDNTVVLRKREFERLGDVSNWLTSEAFDLKQARSLEAEEAITKALALLRKVYPTVEEVMEVDGLLRGSLSEIDRFWVRWSEFRDRLEVAR